MSAGLFRKKPVEVQALQYDGSNYDEVVAWVDTAQARFTPAFGDGSGRLTISTLEGEMTVSPGDWVIRGVQGEHYPCKPDIFEATYETVAPPLGEPEGEQVELEVAPPAQLGNQELSGFARGTLLREAQASIRLDGETQTLDGSRCEHGELLGNCVQCEVGA